MSIAGNSLWIDARTRLLRNRAATASLAMLILLAFACVFGPMLGGNAYDRVYPDYVRVPPSLQAQPTEDLIAPAVERIASRLRARATDISRVGDALKIVLEAPRAIDERSLAFFERSDLFEVARVMSREDGGKRLIVDVPLERNYFFF
ncbi:MAG: ABC transporter permease, partial [Alphaproteobacteria bacterium]|nr:ABC transporter permease [Alphaproteobacteria bacterium]